MPELKKPEVKEVKDTAPKTHKLLHRDPKAIAFGYLKGQEAGLVAKLERIKKWPEKDRELSTARTEDNLNNIREMMASFETSK